MTTWILLCFEKEPNDSLVAEIKLKRQPTLEEMQKLFNLHAQDQMHDSYPLSQEQARLLAQYEPEQPIDVCAYEYCLESSDVNIYDYLINRFKTCTRNT